MDTKTLIHVGVEVVVIGGIVFHFQRKTAKLEGEIQLLRDENTKLKQDLEKIYRVLTLHDQILKGHIPPQTQHHPPKKSTFHTKGNTNSRVVEYPPTSSTYSSKNNDSQLDDEEQIIEEDEENLDELLKEELSELKDSIPEDFIEIECSEESCKIEKPPSKKKVH